MPVTADVARAAGLHRRDYCKSHGVGLADAIIAATAETSAAELKTLNTKHYPMFEGLKPPYLKK
jgi:predicted nucleic acid-binding protein